MGHVRILIATAVAPERDAVLAGLRDAAGVDVVAVGVGPAAAAAGTARLLALGGYDAVVSAGIAGGMPGQVELGGVVVASRSVAADLGAESPDGFLPLSALGFGTDEIVADPFLKHPYATVGAVLSVSTVTGTAAATAELARRHPDAVAEAMEGFGVATAAAQAGVRFAELRTISNLVGPRDKAAWRLPEALAALTEAVAAVSREWP
ncbi:MAG: futalosine hydrolase [Micromonosporaceae bacterium]